MTISLINQYDYFQVYDGPSVETFPQSCKALLLKLFNNIQQVIMNIMLGYVIDGVDQNDKTYTLPGGSLVDGLRLDTLHLPTAGKIGKYV